MRYGDTYDHCFIKCTAVKYLADSLTILATLLEGFVNMMRLEPIFAKFSLLSPSSTILMKSLMLVVPIIYQVGFLVAMISREELVAGWMYEILSIFTTA